MAETKLTAAEVVRTEAAALDLLAKRMEGPMSSDIRQAIDLLEVCCGKSAHVVTTGVGKSGYIARKMAATLNSLGIAAQFLHAAEAAHGDVGMVHRNDVVVAFSYSGETEEVLRLLESLRVRAAAIIAVCGDPNSTLSQAADVSLDVSVPEEACSMNLAPTASTTSMLALADALAIELGQRLGVQPEDFALLHPGGKLGKRLQSAEALMHAGDKAPCVNVNALLPDVIHEMSEKRLGMTTVTDSQGKLLGVISDGDLRRLLEREGGNALSRTAGEVMTRTAAVLHPQDFASTALEIMEAKKITSLVVVDAQETVLGVLHLHDLWEGKS